MRPAFVLALAWTVYGHERAKRELIAQAFGEVRAMMAGVDRELAGTHGALAALGTSPALANGDWEQFYAQAQAVQRSLQAVNVIAFDAAFQQRINTLRPFGAALPADRRPVIERAFATGGPAVSDVFIGPVLGEPLIGVVVPVLHPGAPPYALAASFSPAQLSEMLRKTELPPDWVGAIFDSSGRIVARTHRMEAYVGRPGAPALVQRMQQVSEDTLETATLEGIPVTSVFSKSPVTSWTVAVGIPRATMREQLISSLRLIVAATAVLLLASTALAWHLSRGIAGSLQALVPPALALVAGRQLDVQPLPLKEADDVGKAITRASEMLVAAQHEAHHDTLTTLPNRALFAKVLEHGLAMSDRTGRPLAVLYLDLDGFKLANDLHGHATGDEVLRMVAVRLRSLLRQSDLGARLGGDEFAVILMDTDAEGAKRAAAKVIETLSLPYRIGGLTLELSASIGIAWRGGRTTGEELLARADGALYRAKAEGKGRYALAEET